MGTNDGYFTLNEKELTKSVHLFRSSEVANMKKTDEFRSSSVLNVDNQKFFFFKQSVFQALSKR